MNWAFEPPCNYCGRDHGVHECPYTKHKRMKESAMKSRERMKYSNGDKVRTVRRGSNFEQAQWNTIGTVKEYGQISHQYYVEHENGSCCWYNLDELEPATGLVELKLTFVELKAIVDLIDKNAASYEDREEDSEVYGTYSELYHKLLDIANDHSSREKSQ